jgi:thymidylate synthase (FAD)
MQTKLIWITPDAEKIIGYCARVSNPANQDNPNIEGLLSYCLKNSHWSIFEMANMCVEIETNRAISAQILRHRSFSFQEFSQRYARAMDYEIYPARRQDDKNRQNSIDDLSDDIKEWWLQEQKENWDYASISYEKALSMGIAKEVARAVLPMATTTRLYMQGTIRSWITYLQLRRGNGTQKEHMDIANSIVEIFKENLPTISRALNW